MLSLEPQFFDIFGAMGFFYLTAFALWGLSGRRLAPVALAILLLIGIVGLIVDSVIVYTFYLN